MFDSRSQAALHVGNVRTLGVSMRIGRIRNGLYVLRDAHIIKSQQVPKQLVVDVGCEQRIAVLRAVAA